MVFNLRTMTPNKKKRARKFRAPQLTRIEKLKKGLLADKAEKDFFTVKDIPGKGRGVFLRAKILRKDSFVLEYKGDIIPEAEASYRERIYARNNEGCFIMSFSYQGTKLAVDATRHFESYGRLLNHSREPNIRFHSPFVIDLKGEGLPRIASYALRDIFKGEEVVIDYGVRDGHISWLRNRKIGFAADVDSDSSDSMNCASAENSTSCIVPPSTIASQNGTEGLVVNVDTSDSDDKRESSSLSLLSISMIEGPVPSLGEVGSRKAAIFKLAVEYGGLDDESGPQTSTSDKQMKCAGKKDLGKQGCSAVMSSSSECVLIEDEDCEIIWSELPASFNEQEKLTSNWPARRPVGFSSSTAQQKVAVIKPYVSPSAGGTTQKVAVAMTESELEQLKNIFQGIMFGTKSSHQRVQQAIYKNWNFFSVLINRGVSISQIRSTVNNLFVKT